MRFRRPTCHERGTAQLHDVAHPLFRRVIDYFPDDPQVKGALEQLARMLAAAGEHDEAEELLRRLVDIIDTSPDGISGTSGNVELALAEVIIAAGDQARLGEASSWLDRHAEWLARESIYDMHFRHHLARARIAARLSAAEAADHARSALEWADRDRLALRQPPRPRVCECLAGAAVRTRPDHPIRSAGRRRGQLTHRRPVPLITTGSGLRSARVCSRR